MAPVKINSFIDHTLLAATATQPQIEQLCREAREHGFFSVCVNSFWVPQALSNLLGSNVKVCTVVGFPLGANLSEVKAFEAHTALNKGAHEIDMVLNVGALKGAQWHQVESDIKTVAKVCESHTLKVILETCYLTNDEIITASKVVVNSGANFVKTSTGFGNAGAKAEQIQLIRSVVGKSFGVKASGGIRDRETALAMIEAGASRLGCSASVKICSGEEIKAEESKHDSY